MNFTLPPTLKRFQTAPEYRKTGDSFAKARQEICSVCLITLDVRGNLKASVRSCGGSNVNEALVCSEEPDNNALYGRGGVARLRERHNDTPQISLSALLIGHSHLPVRTQTHTHTFSFIYLSLWPPAHTLYIDV